MTERELINERFKTVFEQLVKRGEIVKNSRVKSMSNFAEKIMLNKGYGHIVRAYLKDNNEDNRIITVEQASRLIQHYGVSWLYMFRGEGKIFSDEMDTIEAKEQLLSGSPKSDNGEDAEDKDEIKEVFSNAYLKNNNAEFSKNILFSSISAFASSTVDVGVHEDSERFYIPGMQGEHIAFYVKGNSMSPTIANGDMVICRSMETFEKLYENEIYAIITKAGNVMIKRIQKIYNKFRQLQHFKCISDNYLEHDPFNIPVNEVRKLLKVERKLTEVGL